MTALLQFNNVASDKVGALSFGVAAGETRLLQLASQEARLALIDMAVGELPPASGKILLQGRPLDEIKPGSIGWIPAAGGLISNLKTWENVTLPLWYHGRRQTAATEENVARCLAELGLEQQEWEKFMSSPTARLKLWERKLAGLLRGLILAPQIMVVDAGLFDDVEAARSAAWIAALEKFAGAAEERAVLAVADTATLLPWKTIE
jgi:ABC-type transporter Mla maintaining outer membrane lipid asymmetry ATPase subunit MlaF